MPSLDTTTCRWLLAAAEHGVLATIGDDRPHVVPFVFAVDGDVLVSAVDHKPKRTTELARLAHLDRDPRCSVLVEHYEDDWERLWWVRVDGTGSVDRSAEAVAAAGELLAARHPQYAVRPPTGPVIRIAIERLTGWAATQV